MHPPVHTRHHIPFFYNKSEKEFQQDSYERYDPMVIRQSALHLMDGLWGRYPMQPILDFSKVISPCSEINSIVEIGCGVGRWIATFAQAFPNAKCWGIDYSYQMLKQAREVWVSGNEVFLNLARIGFSTAHKIPGRKLNNLQFGLAKATALPFADASQDVVLSSFLLDRLGNPKQGLAEMKRVLRPGGNLLFITPLNFQHPNLWEAYYPPVKFHQLLVDMGFEVLDWQEDMLLEEPLDRRRNVLHWKGVAGWCKKGF